MATSFSSPATSRGRPRDALGWRLPAAPNCTRSSNSRLVPASCSTTGSGRLNTRPIAGSRACRGWPARASIRSRPRFPMRGQIPPNRRPGPSGYPRIGIVWAGRPTHHNDRNRSTGLATFAPLTEIPGIALVSLQKGETQGQIGGYWGRAPLVNLGPELRDFGDTMAVVECLERVVAVDTSVVHLAGAMGKAASVMLPYAPDWRWLLDRADSPWYPTLQLFRQGPDRSWDAVVERIAKEVAAAPSRPRRSR